MKVLHLGITLVIFSVLPCSAQEISRAPANYVPDDNMIVVPMVIERNTMEEFHNRHKNDFKGAKRQLRQWIADQDYVEAYGLEGTGAVRIPTPDQKQRFFERNYLRFLSKDVERSTNSSLNETIEEITADDELASIETFEEREEYILQAKKESGAGETKSLVKKEVKVGKEKFKFDIQPRVEMGMMKVTFKSNYINMRAWVGINGNQEVKFYRKFKSIGTNAKVNYFIEQKRVLASIDQPLFPTLIPNFSLRLTHDRQEADPKVNGLIENKENNVIQLRFGTRF